MSFTARVSKPCIKCGIMIERGISAGFTWDRANSGFIHQACLVQHKSGNKQAGGNKPGPGEAIPLGPETVPPSTLTDELVKQAVEQIIKDGAPGSQSESGESSKESQSKKGNGNGKSEKDPRAEMLAKLVASYLPKTQAVPEEQIRKIAKEEAKQAIINMPQSKTVNIKLPDVPPVKVDMAHKLLPLLVKLCAAVDQKGHRPNLYLHGPAGSGKSTAAKQASDVLKLAYGYVSLNPQTPDSRLLGYMHAGGEYVPSEFFKRYTEGGVFCIDEIDNAAASLVTTLNGLLENGLGAFPHGVFKRHPDFVCVCTANTIGRGGDINYPERRALDGAFLERFLFIAWEYDHVLTTAIVGGILGDKAPEFMAWVDKEGKELQAHWQVLIVSPRAYIQGAFLERLDIPRKSIKEMVIARGLK